MTQVSIIIDDGPISHLATIKDTETGYDKFIEFIGGFCCNRPDLIDKIEFNVYSNLDNDIFDIRNIRRNLKKPWSIKSESDLKKLFSIKTWENERIVLFVNTKLYQPLFMPWFTIFFVLQIVNNSVIRTGIPFSPLITLVIFGWYSVFLMKCINEIYIIVGSTIYYIYSHIHDLLTIFKNALTWLKKSIDKICEMTLYIVFVNYDYLQTKWKIIKSQRGKTDEDIEYKEQKEAYQFPNELCNYTNVDKLKKLKEMGFIDDNKNLELMGRYDCKLESVIAHYILYSNNK
jgi:hypothetical protein